MSLLRCSVSELLELTEDQLAATDIAELNLACSQGLPGTEKLDIPAYLRMLEQWTDMVHRGTSNAMRNRDKFPEYRELSEAEYRILTMFAVLYRHVGLTINTESLDPNNVYDGSDSRINFIHAVLQKNHPVTCCTAPVIFASIGRRLGYPIKLVKTREHIFCRWVGKDGERFNIEATDRGYYRKPDERYHNWPKPIHQEALLRGIFLTELTPREELGLFLNLRGTCSLWNLRPVEAIVSYFQACQLDPKDYFFRNDWIIATMFGHAETAAANPYGISSPDPRLWRIPAWCQQWSERLFQLACYRLDVIRSQRGFKINDFGFGVRSELGESLFYHLAPQRETE